MKLGKNLGQASRLGGPCSSGLAGTALGRIGINHLGWSLQLSGVGFWLLGICPEHAFTADPGFEHHSVSNFVHGASEDIPIQDDEVGQFPRF